MPATMELDTALAAADCRREAIPPATCMVPTPGTIVPNAAMAAGISSLAPILAAYVLAPIVVADISISSIFCNC